MAEKWVYDFAEGSKDMRELLGGKGANVAEMTRILGAERVPAGTSWVELDRVLQLCLAKDRDDRFATVVDVRRELIPAIRAGPPFPATPRASWDHETIDDDASTRRTEG